MWQYNYTDELMHYGVPGMKWGVHRAKQYYNAGNKYIPGSYDKANKIISKHQTKITKKISKLDNKYNKLSKTRDKQILKSDVKATKLRDKAYRLENKAGGLFVSKNRYQKLTSKANQLHAQANRLTARSNKTKAMMNRNRKMKELLNSGYDSLSKVKIDIGKKYVENQKITREALLNTSPMLKSNANKVKWQYDEFGRATSGKVSL